MQSDVRSIEEFRERLLQQNGNNQQTDVRLLFQQYVDDLYSAGIVGKNCTNAKFKMKVTNTDKHIFLFTQAIGTTPSVARQERMYVFRVL